MNGGFPPIKLIKTKETQNKESATKVSAYQLPSIISIKDILKKTKSDFILDESSNKLEIVKTF